MKKIFSILQWIIFIAVACLALLLIGSSYKFGNHFSIKMILSGSMEPVLSKGSIIFIKPVDKYRIGDVITFAKVGNKIPITHRIIDVRVDNGIEFYKTKGDANEDEDGLEVTRPSIIGKVFGFSDDNGIHQPVSVPYVGFALNAIKQPIGFALVIVVPSTILIYSEILNIKNEIIRISEERKKKKSNNG